MVVSEVINNTNKNDLIEYKKIKDIYKVREYH